VDLPLSVRAKEHPFVGRGGLKLQAALTQCKLDLHGLRCVDLGSSTGGYTDCMLQAGAAVVYGVVSGSNQLDWKLRQDPRVHVMEKTNARDLKPEALGGRLGFAAADLSFISLKKILPTLSKVLESGAFWVALIKPQFEVLKTELPDGAVLRDANLHQRVCDELWATAKAAGLEPGTLMPSPLLGRDGNKEFLIVGRKI
jgi:23S rRNA (cytidine1920-2'-O)/16S rRNA (cytidine1409-2'-O)-methyltransferase